MSRSRTESGEYREKRNDTLVSTLRGEYGARFAPEVRGNMTLGSLKERLGLQLTDSLDDVLRYYRIRR